MQRSANIETASNTTRRATYETKHKIIPFPVAKPRRSFYQVDTTEVYRADFHTIKDIPLDYFTDVITWQNNVNIRKTHHWVKERLEPYVNQWSKNQTYIEIFPCEYKWLQTICFNDLLRSSNDHKCCQLVELGWNKFGKICKLSYVIQIPAEVYETNETNENITQTPRWLFLCLGADAGIKTGYITPGFKYRKNYQGSVPYLTCNLILAAHKKI
jgi:hypothetical protein